LSAVTREFGARYGVAHEVVPMSDQPVRTLVHTGEGVLAFQDYFVRRRCEPVIRGVEFAGASEAAAAPAFASALGEWDAGSGSAPQRGVPGVVPSAPLALPPATGPARIEALVICPSNPWLSIAPILALPGVRDRIARLAAPRIAVSPIIGGRAVKGPAAKIMRELGREVSAAGVAAEYASLIDGFVLDQRDAGLRASIEATGVQVLVTDTLMQSPADQQRLARSVLRFASECGGPHLADG
jgi:LPPG:FO 2-phospho-L-lactate transferase